MMNVNSKQTIQEIQELVHDVVRTLSVESPDNLFECGQTSKGEYDWHLVGLIGGKEVGKSALVNALVGRPITKSTSSGPGTEKVVAYVHQSQMKSVSNFLESEVPGRFEVIEHDQDELDRQILLDLPDIDSHYSSHFETVRNLLRFILFPVWIQSVEKYADRQPMDLLRQVVQGNAPENFIYCLNKADQLENSVGKEALIELAQDYSNRISKSLLLNQPPTVHMISAVLPEKYDLPKLKKILSHQKGKQEIEASRKLAIRQYGTSLLGWISDQNLPNRVERLERIEEHLGGLLHQRIELPLSEDLLPSIHQDERVEGYLFRETFRARIQQWPIVRLFDSVCSPAIKWLNIGSVGGSEPTQTLSRSVIEKSFSEFGCSPVLSLQASFANCRSRFSQVGEIFAGLPLWEEKDSQICVADLKTRLREALDTSLSRARSVLEPGSNPFGALYRVFIVFGAMVWFPFCQPVLQQYLEEESLTDIPLLIVGLLGVSSLLSSAVFLFVIFTLIWLTVRWRTQRSVSRVLRSLRDEEIESNRGLEAAARDWGLTLLLPLEEEKKQIVRLEIERKRLEKELFAEG